MYHFINEQIEPIIESFDVGHVRKYDWLVEHLHKIDNEQFQKNYRTFWRMNAARLSQDFCDKYFEILQETQQSQPDVNEIVYSLYDVPSNSKAKKTLQFSFSTKMAHMVNQDLPIYDSLISEFYFFEPNIRLKLDDRITELLDFYEFLKAEYLRIQQEGLLNHSIQTFRKHFNPQHFTDAKVIDSLLWAFINFMYNGALIQRRVVFR